MRTVLSGLWALLFLILPSSLLAGAEPPLPKIIRVYPLGGQQGTSVPIEILGEFLSNVQSVEFDCRDLLWVKTTAATSGRLSGVLSISPQAALGPHLLRVLTLDGPSTSALFNVGQFASILETESNDRLERAQPISALPAEIQGRLDGSADIDHYAFQVDAGERWTFDFRSIEYGSSVQAKMILLDSQGNRLAFNQDRDDFDETPFLEHTFDKAGTYYIKLDQYRGPRGFNFGKNCAYILRISALPCLDHVSPLGARVGNTARFRLCGTALDRVDRVYLTQLREAEYSHMTHPYTMPIRFGHDPQTNSRALRIDGTVVSHKPNELEALMEVPSTTPTGLWKLWVVSSAGISDGPKIEFTDLTEYDEANFPKVARDPAEVVINGSLDNPREQDRYQFSGTAGQPLHFWTLAAQLGVPHLDTVLELLDSSGKKLAENDDVVAGQGTLIGNPDSSLFYTPEQNGPLTLVAKDRLGRGGPTYEYRLKIKSEKPGFQLVTTPENFTVSRGGSSEIKVYLIREAGFDPEVSVWFEGLPSGVAVPPGKFRTDQRFEPNADGADMIIPFISFVVRVPESLQPGRYEMQVWGTPTTETDANSWRVQAQTTLILGPILDAWNFIRRPLPSILMTVTEPFDTRLSTDRSELELRRGAGATLELKVENAPKDSSVQLMNLPAGVSYQLTGRENDQITLSLSALPDADLGASDFSAEVKVGNRWAATRPIKLIVSPAAESSRERTKQ
jgi:hypothetical protein